MTRVKRVNPSYNKNKTLENDLLKRTEKILKLLTFKLP